MAARKVPIREHLAVVVVVVVVVQVITGDVLVVVIKIFPGRIQLVAPKFSPIQRLLRLTPKNNEKKDCCIEIRKCSVL